MKKKVYLGHSPLAVVIRELAFDYRDMMRILGVSKSNLFRMLKDFPFDSKYQKVLSGFKSLIRESKKKKHECADVASFLNLSFENEKKDITSRISKLQFEHNKLKTQLDKMVELHNLQVKAFHHIDYIMKNPGDLPSLEVKLLVEKLWFFENEFKYNSPIHHRRMELKIQLIEMELEGLNKLLNEPRLLVGAV